MEILLSESVRAILPGVQTQRGPSLKAVSPPLLHLLQVVRRAGLQDGELEQSLDDLGVYEGLVHHAVPVGREAVLGQVAGRSLLPDVTLMVSPPWPGQVSLAGIYIYEIYIWLVSAIGPLFKPRKSKSGGQ